MKIVLGKIADDGFKILDDDGTDLTEKLHVKSVTITGRALEHTTATLVCYVDVVEAEFDKVDAKVYGVELRRVQQ